MTNWIFSAPRQRLELFLEHQKQFEVLLPWALQHETKVFAVFSEIFSETYPEDL
jgi:hypothetical protein